MISDFPDDNPNDDAARALSPLAPGGATNQGHSVDSAEARPRKGPLSFLSGSLTSLGLAWVSLGISRRVLDYYAEHPPAYKAPIAQSIGTAVKTMVVGTSFLATFSFAFVGLGLFLVFLRSLRPAAATGSGGEAD
ncbi:DUF3082 domain-containing protein [Cyanobium sp. ATX 6F1]|uniref:DUF3082 domain-containing protein n=1 Tax=unclassified Cyanobium TaxID=2627006 RepID=UPI0028F45028|nr:DUF3082 domain-containing protein [Cyanobium sp. ATX 6F1]MCP9916174.1 DUF3082 domain-containing protein [Cyanobium sp. ATX 6F1]